MSTQRPAESALETRLGFLLKHAQMQVSEMNRRALAPLGIDGRELSVLILLATTEPLSQQDAAQRLRIDRTTMVALLDTLETKGLVSRQPHPDDRRRNVLELTSTGQSALEQGLVASERAEAALLAGLGPRRQQELRDALRIIVSASDS